MPFQSGLCKYFQSRSLSVLTLSMRSCVNSVTVLSLIHGKEWESDVSSSTLKKKKSARKIQRGKGKEKPLGLLVNCSFRYLNHKNNPRKEPTYKTPSEKEALILVPFQTEQNLSAGVYVVV